MTESNQILKIENTETQIYHHEIRLGELIDVVEHTADRHQIKQAIIKMGEIRKHLKFAATGIRATKERKQKQ